MSTTHDGPSPGEGHGDPPDPLTLVALAYRILKYPSCTLNALVLLCPLVAVVALSISLIAESLTLEIISAVVAAASGAGTIALVARLVRRGRLEVTADSVDASGGGDGTGHAGETTTDEPGSG